jgi:hypothetical protein
VSVPVALDELQAQVAAYGSVAYLLTVGATGAPHVVSVVVGWRDDELTAGAGTRTAANVRDRPDVSLLWPPAAAGDAYSLIVDGNATVDGDIVRIEPTRAVQHRRPDGADGPTCIQIPL